MAEISNKSPLAPERFPELPAVPGVKIAGVAAGLHYRDRPDLTLAALAEGTRAAGVLTRSGVVGAPVTRCREQLGRPERLARGLVVNAGNANVFTGAAGEAAVEATAAAAADVIGCDAAEIYLASTGVIGAPLDPAPIEAAMPGLAAALSPMGWETAAEAITTTDTFPKGASATAVIDGETVTIAGIAKGSGMIMPDMATMLAFLFTDAALPGAVLQTLLERAMDVSFHCITVDGDTSTSDSVLAFATGAAGHDPVADADDPRLGDFAAKLAAVCIDLAQQVVKDGEGASKFITVEVTGAESDVSARRIGLAIANSPLVKTAIAGGDANWGRIVMAAGKSGEPLAVERIAVAIGGRPVAEAGAIHPAYDEAAATEHVQGQQIVIAFDAGVGDGRARIWTCDLTHGYISINADYRS